MNPPKVYVPKSKAKVQQTKIGDVLRLGFHGETLIAFIKANQNTGGYINLDVVPRRETDQYGNSHSVVLNDWKPSKETGLPPDGGKGGSGQSKPPESDDVPF